MDQKEVMMSHHMKKKVKHLGRNWFVGDYTFDFILSSLKVSSDTLDF